MICRICEQNDLENDYGSCHDFITCDFCFECFITNMSGASDEQLAIFIEEAEVLTNKNPTPENPMHRHLQNMKLEYNNRNFNKTLNKIIED